VLIFTSVITTKRTEIMRTLRTVSEVRNGNGNRTLNGNGRTPVIVTIPVSARKQDLGIQFWTKENIEEGQITNPDNTISKLVEIY
jgi:hypothetical protein